MKNKKIIRNMIFMIILAVFFLFDGEIADALSCSYDYEMGIINKYTIHLQLNLRKDNGYFEAGEWKGTGYSFTTGNNANGSMPTVKPFTNYRLAAQSLQLIDGKCPNLIMYKASGAIGYLYRDVDECSKDLGHDCSLGEVVSSPGTMNLEEGEEPPISKECSPETLKEFANRTTEKYNEVFSNDSNDGIESAFEIHFNTFKSKDIVDYASYEALVSDYYEHIIFLKEETKKLSSVIEKIAGEYYCDGVKARAASIQNEIAQKYEELSGMFSSFLIERRNHWVDANEFSSDEMQKIEKLDKEVSELSDKYLTEVKEEIKGKTDGLLEGIFPDGDVTASCEAILGDVLDIIQTIFSYMKLLAPILVIFFGSMDFAKAVVASDDKEMKKATSNFMKRLIAAVLLFFIPWFIELMFSLPGLELGIDNVICGISKVVIGR